MRLAVDLLAEQGTDYFQDFFFYHQLRGVKGAYVHDPEDDAAVAAEMISVCEALDWTKMPPALQGDWYIDVGLEIRRPSHVLQWNTHTHKKLVKALLPSRTMTQVSQLLAGPRYILDNNAQLMDFGGFRLHPEGAGASEEVVYINVYTTDKTMHYQLHHGVFDQIKPRDLFPETIEATKKHINEWTKTFRESMEHQQEAAARCEVRVTFRKYATVLRTWPDRNVSRFTSAVPAKAWWYYNRAMACYFVMANLKDSGPVQRGWAESLALGATIAYILNALLYTP
ncbi:uncharacterized protein C8Q71DRAFT_700003, partial [Rhodofomes roseus]